MQNLISCRVALFENIDTAFQLFPEAGVHHAEVAPPQGGNYELLQAKAGQAGITIASLATEVDLDTDEKADALKPVIDGAAAIDVRHIFVSAKAAADVPRADVDARLRSLAKYASDRGRIICMETHPPFGTNGDIARQTIEQIGDPGWRYNFDTANVCYYNKGADTITELRKVLDLVASVHLKDTLGGFECMHFPALGTGVVDFPKVFQLLGERNFTGPYTLEVEGQAVAGFDQQQRLGFLRQCMDYLRSIGAAS